MQTKKQRKYNRSEKGKERMRIHKHTLKGIYSIYRCAARKFNRSFTLNINAFGLLISSPCYYCGEVQEKFNGVDRVDSEEGYTEENCVSCCAMCNRMKNKFLKEDFIFKCQQITDKRR